MNCNCNNNTKNTARIKHVFGNVLRLAIPLTLRTVELVDVEIDGEIKQQAEVTDTDFIPASDKPVKVILGKGSVKVVLDAEMRDGNIAYVEEKGKTPVGVYDITIECYDDNGNPYRFKQNTTVHVVDTTAEAGIVTPIEYEVTTWYLDAAIFLAMKGEDGVGIADIVTQSSAEIGGVNTVTIILTNGQTRSFTILNGSGYVDNEFSETSQHPLSNKKITERFNAVDQSIAEIFGDVDYDSQSKAIRFWNKGKTNILATLDARPFIKDGMVNSVYISNNTLVITFNTDSGREAIGVPLTSVFNPNNYYNKTQVDNRIANALANINLTNYYTKSQTDDLLSGKANKSEVYNKTYIDGQFYLASRRVVTITETVEWDEVSYSADMSAAQIYSNHTAGRTVIAKLGDSIGQLVYCDDGNVMFLFGNLVDEVFLMVCNDSLWWREEITGGGSIEIDDNPTAESENAVSSGGVYAALTGLVSGIRVNNGNPQYPVNGIVNLTVQGGGYTPPIPKTDLASDVQASLGKADTALQSQTQADWNQTTTTADDYIKNKPTLATVATSGSYNDLQDKPTIPAAYDDTTLSGRVSALENAGYTTNTGTVTGISVNGGTAQQPTNGVVNLTVATGGDNDIVGISDGTPNDGAVVFTKRNGETITLNFNHVHPQYLKYELLADEATYTALATKDSSTLYLIPETT